MLWHSRHRYPVTWLRCVLRNTRACAVFASHCGQCSPLGWHCVNNHPSLISSSNRSTIGKSRLWTLSHQALLLDMSQILFCVCSVMSGSPWRSVVLAFVIVQRGHPLLATDLLIEDSHPDFRRTNLERSPVVKVGASYHSSHFLCCVSSLVQATRRHKPLFWGYPTSFVRNRGRYRERSLTW